MTAPAGLLLAAGAGRRFGRPKALVPWHGQLLVERGATMLVTAGLAPVAVVLGAQADRVQAQADLSGVTVVTNPHWDGGMGSSLVAGLEALAASPAAVVALADQPLVGAEAVRRLVAAWRAGALAAVAAYGGEPRNPVLLDRRVWSRVRQLADGDRGARAFLRANAQLVTVVDCDGTGSPDDIDTPADLAVLAARGGAQARG